MVNDIALSVENIFRITCSRPSYFSAAVYCNGQGETICTQKGVPTNTVDKLLGIVDNNISNISDNFIRIG